MIIQLQGCRKEGEKFLMERSRLILASQSPRRCELLRRFGVPFETFVPDVDESCNLTAAAAVEDLSRRKALAAASSYSDAYIIAADTLVSVDGNTLGKPSGREEALRMLTMLSGRTHSVFTGVTVISPAGDIRTGTDHTDVTFCTVPREEMINYADSGEPLDKAGGYALQGRASLWITHISGSDTSVIGLPLYLVRTLLISSGFPLAAVQAHY